MYKGRVCAICLEDKVGQPVIDKGRAALAVLGFKGRFAHSRCMDLEISRFHRRRRNHSGCAGFPPA